MEEAYNKIRGAALKGEEEVGLYVGAWTLDTPNARAAQDALKNAGWTVTYRRGNSQRDEGSTKISWAKPVSNLDPY